MKKLYIFIICIVLTLITGCGNENDKEGKNNTTNEIPKNATEIDVATRDNFSNGVAWVKAKNGNYYLIDATGKALFGLDTHKGDRIYDVEHYSNEYGIVSYHNEELNTDYKKIFDKKGKMVYAEWDGTRARHEILAGPDDKGYILVDNLGKVESINLITGKSVTNSAKWTSETRKMESLGGGIFYNQYVGFFNASSGSRMPLEALDIYNYDSYGDFVSVKTTSFNWTRFINGKAIFSSSIYNYIVTNEGEVTEIEKLEGYKLAISTNTIIGDESSYNGQTVYGEKTLTKDKGYFDLEGNKVLDLSKYDIYYTSPMYNDKLAIILKAEELNERVFTVLDKNGKELFKPIKSNSYYELDDDTIYGDNQILNYKGETLIDISKYDWALGFDYGGEGTITVCPKSIDLESNRFYLNSKGQEIKPYYENELKLK